MRRCMLPAPSPREEHRKGEERERAAERCAASLVFCPASHRLEGAVQLYVDQHRHVIL